MFFPETGPTYCPARVLEKTIQFGNRVIIPIDEIPVQGCCSMSSTGKEPCQFSYPEYCSRFQGHDLYVALSRNR